MPTVDDDGFDPTSLFTLGFETWDASMKAIAALGDLEAVMTGFFAPLRPPTQPLTSEPETIAHIAADLGELYSSA